jgi:hypothetical protein
VRWAPAEVGRMRVRRGGEMRGHEKAGHSGKNRDRREVIGGGGISGEKSHDRREMIGGGGFLGEKGGLEGGERGEEVGFR